MDQTAEWHIHLDLWGVYMGVLVFSCWKRTLRRIIPGANS